MALTFGLNQTSLFPLKTNLITLRLTPEKGQCSLHGGRAWVWLPHRAGSEREQDTYGPSQDRAFPAWYSRPLLCRDA